MSFTNDCPLLIQKKLFITWSLLEYRELQLLYFRLGKLVYELIIICLFLQLMAQGTVILVICFNNRKLFNLCSNWLNYTCGGLNNFHYHLCESSTFPITYIYGFFSILTQSLPILCLSLQWNCNNFQALSTFYIWMYANNYSTQSVPLYTVLIIFLSKLQF